MARATETIAGNKNGRNAKPTASGLGRRLRRISDKIVASGEKLLTRRELEREHAQGRGGIR